MHACYTINNINVKTRFARLSELPDDKTSVEINFGDFILFLSKQKNSKLITFSDCLDKYVFAKIIRTNYKDK